MEARSLKPSDVIALSALSQRSNSVVEHLAIVVPDELTQSSQQRLIDALSAQLAQTNRQSGSPKVPFLIWRSAALALAWCQKHEHQFQRETQDEEHDQIEGHIACVSLGMDGFQLSFTEIRSRVKAGRTWLLPVVEQGCERELQHHGLNFLLGMMSGETREMSATELWKRVCGPGALDRWLQSDKPIPKNLFQRALLSDDAIVDPLYKLFDTNDWLSLLEMERLEFIPWRQRIKELRQHQFRLFDSDSKTKTCLGGIVDGSLGTLTNDSGRSLGNILQISLLRDLQDHNLLPPESEERFLLGDGQWASVGAARCAVCIAKTLPTYLERLQKIEIHAIEKSDLNENVSTWTPLVGTDQRVTVNAGDPYSPDEPMRGFKIQTGADRLTLTLRQPRYRLGEKSEPFYKEVDADLRGAVDRDEDVLLNVKIRPGQGYAVVDVESVRPGVFKTRLDWQKMRDASCPDVDNPAYLKEIWSVADDYKRWKRVETPMKNIMRSRRSDLLEQLSDLRGRYMNKRGQPERHGDTAYLGCVSSDGTVPGKPGQVIFTEFQKFLDSTWRDLEHKKKLKHKLAHEVIRTGGWMYAGMPARLQTHVEDELSSFSRTQKVHPSILGAAGNSLTSSHQFKLLISAAHRRFEMSTEGINNWLRALRNIIQYRETALHPQAADRKTIARIAAVVTETIRSQVSQRNFEILFGNSLRITIFLLKRRRYDPDFLTPDANSQESRTYEELLEALECIAEDRPLQLQDDFFAPPQYGKPKKADQQWAKVILPFLERRATSQDAKKFLELVREEEELSPEED